MAAIPKASDQLQITICGGGNSTHVMAGLLGAKSNIKVNIFDVMEKEVEDFLEMFSTTDHTITVRHSDGKEPVRGRVNHVSSKAKDVVPGSSVIILAVPAFAHEIYFRAMSGMIAPGAVVGVMVAQGGVDWCVRDALGADTLKQITFFAFETLPWACRIDVYAQSASILGCKHAVDLVVLDAEHHTRASKFLSDLIGTHEMINGVLSKDVLPGFVVMPNFISATLMNINSVWHPGISYGQFHDWDMVTPYSEEKLFYEGVDDKAVEALTNMSNEVLAIASAVHEQLNVNVDKVTHVFDWILRSYANDILDKTDLGTSIRTNKGYKGLKHSMIAVEGGFVPNTRNRYYTEDFPFGLVVTRGVAEVMGVPTPWIDRVITWGQCMLGKEYLVNGKLLGKDIGETRAPQRYGLTTPQQLIGA